MLDFDGTVTIDDTTGIIGSRCLANAREMAPTDTSHPMLPDSMEYYSNLYMQEYQQAKQALVGSSESQSIGDEVSRLSETAHVEKDSFMRVHNAILSVPGGIQKLHHDQARRDEFMMESGRQAIRNGEVRIRDPEALHKLIARVQTDGNDWRIVSVSWSRRFILGALIEAGLINGSHEEAVAGRIRCNELLAPNPSGNIICSARDKQNEFHKLLAEWAGPLRDEHGRDAETFTIYVGDSTTDIGCLVSSGIGMYLQAGGPGEDKVVPTLERLGIQTMRITDLPTYNAPAGTSEILNKLRQEGKPPHIVCLVKGFEEINDWISKLRLDFG